MYTYLHRAVEYAVVGRDGDFVDVDVELFGQHLRYFEQHSLAVYAADAYHRLEVKQLVHRPFRIENPVAETRLESCRHRTGAVVYLHMAPVVDISQYVVARNAVATLWEHKLVDVVFGYVDGLLLVEILVNREELLRAFLVF